jgi:hypothetical protein
MRDSALCLVSVTLMLPGMLQLAAAMAQIFVLLGYFNIVQLLENFTNI